MQDSHAILIQYLKKKIQLSEEDADLIRKAYQPKTLKKKEYLFRQGFGCDDEAFVISGSLRMFYIDNRGLEHVLYFAFQEWWIGDLAAFYQRSPSQLNAQALEDTELLVVNYEAKEELFAKIPALERLFRIIIQKHLTALQSRFLSTISESAEVRYQKLLERSPKIELLVPQHQIASYLGILPESLSRMKRQMLKK